MEKVTLNENEIKVLESCINGIYGDNGIEFDVPSVEGLSINQVKGYLSQLEQKGFILMYGRGESYADGEVWLNTDGKFFLDEKELMAATFGHLKRPQEVEVVKA